MRNPIPTPDKNFLKVHSDLAALYDEIQEKENALQQLVEEKKALKAAIRTTKNELKKRLTALGAWPTKEANVSKTPAKKQQVSR